VPVKKEQHLSVIAKTKKHGAKKTPEKGAYVAHSKV
jgi:hypothetical protein